jgi:hypothetical protein
VAKNLLYERSESQEISSIDSSVIQEDQEEEDGLMFEDRIINACRRRQYSIWATVWTTKELG